MLVRKTIATLSMFGILAGGALADKLPKDAVELSADEVKAIYSGKSTDWSKSSAYFAPDGQYFGVAKDGSVAAEGTWAVNGNKVCADIKRHDLKGNSGIKSMESCWTWFKQGKKYWTFWSGEKDQVNGYYDGEIKKLSKGDKVSKKFKKLVASN